jgi:GYD domain
VSRRHKKVGTRFETAYLAFGKYDLMLIIEALDNVSAAATSLAVTAGGVVKAYETAPLMTIVAGIEAMRKGADVAAAFRLSALSRSRSSVIVTARRPPPPRPPIPARFPPGPGRAPAASLCGRAPASRRHGYRAPA